MAKVLNRSSSACPPLVLGVGAGPARGASACRAAGRACRTGSGRPTSLRTRSTSRCGPWKPSAASALPACSHSFAARSSRLLARTLMNFRKHLKDVTGIDPCSSAAWFAGWRVPPVANGIGPPPVASARTWLARVGWRRHGLIRLEEQPN